MMISGTETGMVLWCFKGHKDERNQVSSSLLLSFQSSEMETMKLSIDLQEGISGLVPNY